MIVSTIKHSFYLIRKLYLQHPFQGVVKDNISEANGQPSSRYDTVQDSDVINPCYAKQHQHEQQMEHVYDYIDDPKQLVLGRQEESRYIGLEELEPQYTEMNPIQPGGEEQLVPELEIADKNPEGVDNPVQKRHESLISHRRLAAVLLT